MEDIIEHMPRPLQHIKGHLYTAHYRDARERIHVVLVNAPDRDEALKKIVAYQEGYNGFLYDGPPTIDEVQEVEFYPDNNGVSLLYHQDYD